MKNSRYSIFFVCLLFLFSGHSQTNENKYSFTAITTEDGLSNNIIYNILQDREGYIWIATDNGLNRFDGYTAKKFFHKTTDSSSVSSSVIRSLIEDLDGNIWIGTKNGLNLYDKETQSFKQPIKLHNSSFINQEIMKMSLDSDGRIWMNTLNDIGFFNPKTLHFQLIYSSGTNPYMILANGKVWILNEDGELSYYDINLNALVFVLKDASLARKAIYFGEHSKQLWLAAEFQSEIDAINHKVLPKLPNNLAPNYLLEIDAKVLWMGTNEGLFEYNDSLKEIRKINLGQSTLVQQIRSIYKDNLGGIWVGTLGGVYHYDPNRKVFHHIALDKDSDDIVMGLSEEDTGIYANALGKGIYHKPHNSDKFKKLNLPKTFPDQGLFIWDIEEVHASNFPIWMATNDGLLCFDPIKSRFQKVELPFINKDEGISFSILNTNHDYLWLATHKTIHKITKKEGKLLASFSLTEFMKHSGIQKIIALGDYIFIATEGEGLFSFHIKTHTISKVNLSEKNTENQIFKTPIWDLYATEKILWIGTNQGLYNLNLNRMIIMPVLQDDQIIFSIIQDDEGVLWMGSDKGIKTYNPSNQLVRYYSTDNGLKNKEFNRKSTIRTVDGHLWFGGVNGITSFDPNEIKKDNPNKPYVHITNLRVITSDSTFNVPHFQKKVVLPWEHNTIEIEYVGLNYTHPSQNKYKYKMKGYDPNWVSNNEPDKARYVRLPVGTYTFNVIAANNDSIWNSEGDNIEITITPPIWRTKTAYVIYVLTLLGLVSLVRRLKKYRTRIKEVEFEKAQIAKKVEKDAILLNNKSKIYLDKLKYIKSDGNYLEFVTDNKIIIDRNKLKDILDDLPPNFIRVHRSYVINKNFINASNSKSIFLKPNIEIPLSRTFKANIA